MADGKLEAVSVGEGEVLQLLSKYVSVHHSY